MGVRIGENFTEDMYLAKVGPGPWEGIVIANLTQLPALPQWPGLDIRVRDNTPARFAVLDETVLDLDLNKDGEMNRTFYMVAFDGKDDGQQNMTHNIIDDDLNITEDGWQNSSANESEPGKYKDFYSNEVGEREFREPMPNGGWYGGVRFAQNDEEVSWEDEPRWDILNFNDTHALLKKEKWKFDPLENITFIVKAYNFDQTPVTGANVSLLYLLQFTPFGGNYINITKPGAPEVVYVQNITDSSGFAILRLENSTWGYGEYMAVLQIETLTGEEIAYNWFKVE